ncbi:hypothetical protein HTVC104P_gp64 [Pelagibacter phage HTVC104P]|nr:hypothetical protein HTVC104P_gp64 [Pelagibacter phage HTVC104P]
MAQIDKPNLHFRTKLYAGTGSANSITYDESGNMQPDLMWIKSRGHTASWLCNDVVRGVTKRLKLDANSAESTETQMITSFDTNGFSLGTSTTANQNTTDFASYSWKANGAGSSNSDGSTTSTVSVNTASGCSIVQYAGSSSAATIGHGLGAAPNMIIVKTYSSGYEWAVYHKNLGHGENLYLDSTGAASSTTTFWNNTAPTSSVFSTGGQIIYTNYSGQNYIAYCFTEKKGFSRFGLYSGNANADGTFVYCGFKPAWILRKCVTGGTAENWVINDIKRDTYNQSQKALFPNNVNVEDTATHNAVDFLSNGFKCRTADGRTNGTSKNYIYAAFAENPIVGSNNIPATAK